MDYVATIRGIRTIHPESQSRSWKVKQIGQSEGAERQLFEYAFHAGVPLAILTDGQEWNFFLPGEQGDYGERRVYKLDIVDRDIAECASRLNRYLKYEAIVAGTALEAAREDYRNVSRDRQMRATLPKAWSKLVEDEDELLIELVADSVESLCGYKPDPDSVARFLKEHVTLRAQGAAPQPLRPPSAPSPTPAGTPHPGRTGQIGFTLNGRFVPARSARDVMIAIFENFADGDTTFLERFAALPKHGRTRRFLARSPDELYPGRPDLARDHSAQLKSGWWLGTNVSRAAITRIIEMACEVAHVSFGQALTINLGE